MKLHLLMAVLLLESAAAGNIITEVRSAVARKNFALGEAKVNEYRAQQGVNPELVEAVSWLGRGALAENQLDRAEAYAQEAHRLSLEQLKNRRLDAERHLPIALGAAIEVQAHVMAERGERSEAIEFLRRELVTYRNTSIRTRIQKNIHLLSLEGKPAPPLEIREWLGLKPATLAELRGRPVLLFFWAHWCGDCKWQAQILAELKKEYGSRGLVLIGPTQRYGYAASGQEAGPAEELKYIDDVRRRYYAELADMPVPVSQDNFKNYGASTTPTLVLLDDQGLVRMYHPGRMSYKELASKVEAVVSQRK
jgi:thiol-disulfide isomerase/thioredoxin